MGIVFQKLKALRLTEIVKRRAFDFLKIISLQCLLYL